MQVMPVITMRRRSVLAGLASAFAAACAATVGRSASAAVSPASADPPCHDCGGSTLAGGWCCWDIGGMPGGGGVGTLCDTCHDERFEREVCAECGGCDVDVFQDGQPRCLWHRKSAGPYLCADCYTPIPRIEDCPDGPILCGGCGKHLMGFVLSPVVRAELARLFPRSVFVERYRTHFEREAAREALEQRRRERWEAAREARKSLGVPSWWPFYHARRVAGRWVRA